METIETQLISSRKIREFLSRYSESQWHRVIKASVLMGIQEVEGRTSQHSMSIKDIEELAGNFEF